MSLKKLRLMKKVACLCTVGAIAFQAGTCSLSDPTVGALLQSSASIVTQQIANIISDTVFFLIDNLLVRATAA